MVTAWIKHSQQTETLTSRDEETADMSRTNPNRKCTSTGHEVTLWVEAFQTGQFVNDGMRLRIHGTGPTGQTD